MMSSRATAVQSRDKVPPRSCTKFSFRPTTWNFFQETGKCFGVSLANCSIKGCNAAFAASMSDARLQTKADIVSLDGILRNFQREVDVAVFPGEAWSGDADDGVVLANELQMVCPRTAGSELKWRCQNL